MPAPTPEQIEYMLRNADDSRVKETIICCIVCGALSTAFVLLRLLARRITGLSMQWSDWSIIIAWIFAIVFYICFGLTTRYGAGKHVVFVTNPRMLQILNMVDVIVYGYSITFIKFSILALYGAIFPRSVSATFHRCLWIVAALIMSWNLAAMFSTIFSCFPVEKAWDATIGGQCIDVGKASSAMGIINAITDVVILVMPIPLLSGLRLGKNKKVLLICTFAIGSSACIVSIVRVPFTFNLGSSWDPTWDMLAAGLNSAVELAVGILAASIPTYMPLLRKFFGIKMDSTAKSSSYKGHYKMQNSFRFVETSISTDGMARDYQGPPRNGVMVERDIEMSSHKTKSGTWTRIRDDPDDAIYK